MISFNKFGYISPPGLYILTVDEFEEIFTGMNNEPHRRGLFKSYKLYVSELLKIVEQPFFQLIGGSFVTCKTWPQDIDIVTFVPYVFEQNNTLKQSLRELFERYEFSSAKSGLHTFFSLIPDESNPDQAKFEAHYQYWIDTFSSSIEKNTDPKGIVKLHFS
ncbi:DUF6932 family protein [Spirosoma pollinicola]|uniref:Polymerase nucleotidyl transferase domain-containing protein n=1 Tax=Spirosoma pollinicola TaxID=2057025 RepID=A0A2K8Z6V6_9BACT|nr:hypothetical protein [Spirosoma pollinicola]AUD05590.1 hypothetical protein CWM47_29355 [Spirosoma pollinicola]